MKRLSPALSVAALLAAACSHPTAVSAPVPEKGKPTAPVAVAAELGAKRARVVVTFEAAAEQVTIGVGGVDGLAVEGKATVVEGGTFARGEAKSFDVAFTPGPGRSQLAVSVSGTFGGAHRARVVAFTVGTGAAPESPGTVLTTDDGERVRVVPAAP